MARTGVGPACGGVDGATVRALIVLVVALAVPVASAADDPAYLRANAQLAKAVPPYPRARVLVEEAIGGEVGSVPYEAVQRISFLARPQTQGAAMRFYGRKLGPRWRRHGVCFVSGPRLVVVLVSTPRRRLGVLVDSRGSRRCYGLAGILGDLLGVGYPS